MVKAEITTKEGTHISIDGSEDEIKRILGSLANKNLHPCSVRDVEENKSKGIRKGSIVDSIYDLKEEGFFNKPRGLLEIKNALAEKGAVYEVTTLSPKLLKMVRKRQIGRISEENKWKYVWRP